jgi:DNA-directed RNA polymerase subunit RPC12/RpoP|tara:strand:- start:806 stop:997 length:192 start_codon:yes stop_codon:yes gene_type:complete
MDKATKKIICPRCVGNGFFKVKESAERQVDTVVQCPMCSSQGEIDEEKANTIYVDADGVHRVH